MSKNKLNMLRQVSMKLMHLDKEHAVKFAASLGLSLSENPLGQDGLTSFLRPQEEDFIYIPVRLLSADSVQGGMFNFAHLGGKALKEAVDKFNDVPILKDHFFTVENIVGRVQGVFWDETTPGAPPGVTGVLKVDSKIDPKTARNLITGNLDSVSVTIQFDYEQSHPEMSAEDFYWKMGEMVDGKLVQALVTAVTRIYETSLVWQGADPHAKTIRPDGSIHTPGLSLNPSNNPPHTEDIPMNFAKLMAKLGIKTDPTAVTDDQLVSALEAAISAATTAGSAPLETKVTELTAQVATLNTDLTAKTTEVTTLKAEVESLKPQAELGAQFLKDQRAEATRLYKIVAAGKEDPAMLSLMESASLEAAKGFITTFAPQAEKIAPLTCSKCGSVELSRRSSKPEPEGNHNHVSAATDRLNEQLVNRLAGITTK